MSRSARLGHSVGEAGGNFLSAFLQAQANKDLREEQELQRENIRTALKYYLDPKTELGPGVMSELGTEYPGLLKNLHPEQGYGLPAEEEESFDDMTEKMRKDEFKNLSPEERKHYLFKTPIPEEKEEKRAKNITGAPSLATILKGRETETSEAQEALSGKLRHILKSFGYEEYKDEAGEAEQVKKMEKDEAFLKALKGIGLPIDDYVSPTGDALTALADSAEAARTDPDILSAIMDFEPKRAEEKGLDYSLDELLSPVSKQAVTGGQQDALQDIPSNTIKNLRAKGYSDSEIIEAWQGLKSK